MSASELNLGKSVAATEKAMGGFDVERLRQDFPALHRQVHGRQLAYLDNAATAQKPRQVIERIRQYYEEENANIHRGVHYLSEISTRNYEAARESVRRFIGAEKAEEIIFVRGTTEAINLVANSYGRSNIGEGDEVLITAMEHHSGIVPWQILCEATGAALKVAPINDRGELIFEEFEKLLSPRTKLVCAVHVSNALGSINPVKDMIEAAHRHGVPVLLDGAQAVPHCRVDVRELDADFYAFSGHKLFGPTGIGVLYGKKELLDAMPPYQGGGDMIRTVTFEKSTYAPLPAKFEAGTPNIAGGIGLGAAIEYLEALDWKQAEAYEKDLLDYGTEVLREVPGLRLIGTAGEKAGVLSFVLEGVHPHDIGTILDQDGVAIRTGHHCAQPVMEFFEVPATARASLAFYNTREELDALVASLRKVKEMFS